MLSVQTRLAFDTAAAGSCVCHMHGLACGKCCLSACRTPKRLACMQWRHQLWRFTSAAPMAVRSRWSGLRPYWTIVATELGLLGVSCPVPVCRRQEGRLHRHVGQLTEREEKEETFAAQTIT